MDNKQVRHNGYIRLHGYAREIRRVDGMSSEDIRLEGDKGGGEAGLGELDQYAVVLREKGIKVTSPRLRILQYLEDVENHPDADTIYSTLKADNPSLSKTTVYNTLDLFHRKGLVSVLTISKTEQRYEPYKDMHHHLLCGRCGRIYDIDISCPYLDGMLHGEHKVEEVHGYFKGTCKHCLSEVRADEEKEEV
jgi:Fe2+ or Zn2+ uptake regulation protein